MPSKVFIQAFGGTFFFNTRKSFPAAGKAFSVFKTIFQPLEFIFQFSKMFSRGWKRLFGFQKRFPAPWIHFYLFMKHFQQLEFIFVFFLAFSRGRKRVEGILMSKKNPYQTSQPDTDQTNNKLYLYEKTNTTNLIQFGYFLFIWNNQIHLYNNRHSIWFKKMHKKMRNS